MGGKAAFLCGWPEPRKCRGISETNRGKRVKPDLLLSGAEYISHWYQYCQWSHTKEKHWAYEAGYPDHFMAGDKTDASLSRQRICGWTGGWDLGSVPSFYYGTGRDSRWLWSVPDAWNTVSGGIFVYEFCGGSEADAAGCGASQC